MPDQVPLVSSKKALRAFKRLGFRQSHANGSHVTLVREHDDRSPDITVIMMGQKELDRFTLAGALKLAGVTPAEFKEKLR